MPALPSITSNFGNNSALHLHLYGDYTQNVTANTSTLSIGVDFMHDYALSAPMTQTGSIIVGNSTASAAYVLEGTANGVWRRLLSRNITVVHNSDGTATLPIYATVPMGITWNGAAVGTQTISMGNVTLATIPRATQPAVSPTSVQIGQSVTISLPRASTAFTHDLAWSIAGQTGVIDAGVATSYVWTVPTSIAQYITSPTSTVTITATTKSGSTTVGSKSVNLGLTVPDSAPYLPTISSITITDPSPDTSAFSVYVQGHSQVRVQTTATGGQAGSGSVSISGVSVTITSNARTVTLSGTDVTFDVIQGSGTVTITVTATDQRGKTVTQTRTISVLAYLPPQITSCAIFRATASGVAADDGTRIAVSLNATIASLSSQNAHAIQLKYRQVGATAWTTVAISTAYTYSGTYVASATIGVDYAYEAQVVLTDTWNTVIAATNVPSQYILMHVSADGKKVSFGRKAQVEALEVAMKLRVYDKVALRAEVIGIALPVTLSTSWSSGLYTLSDSRILSTQDVVTVELAATATAAQKTAWDNADIGDGEAQVAGSTKLKAFGTVPTIALPVMVTVLQRATG
jgi:hypothetical protein